MANFSGEITFKIKFKNLNVPVGFGMTTAILNHECLEQAYARSPWTKISREIKRDNFSIERVSEKIKRATPH